MPFWFAMFSLRFFFDNMNRYLEKKGINLCLIKSFDNTFAMLANWSTASLRIWCLASSPLERISRAMNDSESSWPKSWASYPKSLFTIRCTFTAIITFSSLLSSWAIWITCVRMRFPLSFSVNSLATTLIEFPANSLSLIS